MTRMFNMLRTPNACICGTPDHAENDPNEPKWNPDCPIHTIGHYHKPGCCDVLQDNMAPHRHMTSGEYEAEFPTLYDAYFTVGDDRYRLEARRYWDGVGATVTRCFSETDDSGVCFDFNGEIVGPLIEQLQALKKTLSNPEVTSD